VTLAFSISAGYYGTIGRVPEWERAENPYQVMGDIVKPWLRNTYGAFRRLDCLVWRSLILVSSRFRTRRCFFCNDSPSLSHSHSSFAGIVGITEYPMRSRKC
jgi:hypothetical protein